MLAQPAVHGAPPLGRARREDPPSCMRWKRFSTCRGPAIEFPIHRLRRFPAPGQDLRVTRNQRKRHAPQQNCPQAAGRGCNAQFGQGSGRGVAGPGDQRGDVPSLVQLRGRCECVRAEITAGFSESRLRGMTKGMTDLPKKHVYHALESPIRPARVVGQFEMTESPTSRRLRHNLPSHFLFDHVDYFVLRLEGQD
jgi:hypothetical protein